MQVGHGAAGRREVVRDQVRWVSLRRGKARERGHAILAPQEGAVEALTWLTGGFVPDGELVALDSQDRPSFQLMQNIL